MTRILSLALVLVAASAAPAFAVPACSGSYIFSPERYSETEINELNLQMLRSIGVDATRAEMWGGCIRAFVETERGEEMQFFEPLNLRRVE